MSTTNQFLASFNTVVGQDEVKSSLTFRAKGANHGTGMCPPILFKGPKGMGKTEFARAFARSLKKSNGKTRNFVELNSSAVTLQSFFENLYPVISKAAGIVILFDEAHDLKANVQTMLLSVLNTEKNPIRTFTYNGVQYEFDLRDICFLFATTDFEKLAKPLKDRLRSIDFRPYTSGELGQIMTNCLSDVDVEAAALASILPTLRGNARSAVERAQDIQSYADQHSITTFTLADWKSLRKSLNILPHNLSSSEVEVLKLLQRGPCTLRNIEAFTGENRGAIQRDVEVNLVRLGFMKINALREITPAGIKILVDIESGIY